MDGNHWVAVTNMDLYSNKGYTDRVLIFDSLVPRKVGMNLKKQVCSFVRPMEPTVIFDIANIMPQTNQYDCGLFAIANATALLHGHSSAKCVWDMDKMREHLIQALRRKSSTNFQLLRSVEYHLVVLSSIQRWWIYTVIAVCHMMGVVMET